MSFPELLEAPPARGRGITFLAEDAHVSWSQLHEESLRAAGGLQARGARVVGLLGGSSRELVTALLGALAGGVVPVVLPVPNTRREGAQRPLPIAGLTHVVYDPPYEELARAYGDAVAAAELPGAPGERVARAPDETMLLQLTSGTTDLARAVTVTDGCLTAYVTALAQAVERDPETDLVLSWLPLHYDLGLISALLFAASTGTEFALATPETFIRAPASWMHWMAELGATETLAPSFAFGIAASMPVGGDLSRVRMMNNGGELVSAQAARRFIEAMQPHGLDPGVMSCGYGLAEATSAVTVRKPGGGLLVDDRTGRELASQGPPLPGVRVRIADNGEIEIAGPTVCPGGDIHDGWLRTGDLGYIVDGELYPCGRLKDLIIAAGRNIAPEEIEGVAGALPGVRMGNVIAFSVEGSKHEEIVVVAEVRGEPDGVRDAIARAVRGAVGMRPHDVVLIAPGSLPKTASGKLQRGACRERYLEGALNTV